MPEKFEFDFEKLRVYQLALEFIDKIFEVYRHLPSEFHCSLGSNLIRAGLSIANNIAEGNDKKSQKERCRFFGISSDSTRECISVFNVLKRQQFINDQEYTDLRKEGREITSMLRALMGS